MAETRDAEAWAAAGESHVQEFKIRTSGGCLREAGETICAFLNGEGGRVVFGIADDGTLVGQDVTDKTLREVAGLEKDIEPPAFPRVERVESVDGKSVIAVETERGSRRPYTYKGIAYRRVGPTTVELSREQYNEMLLEELHAVSRWENQVVVSWSLADLDGSQIGLTVEEAIRRGRLTDPQTRDPGEVLRGLGLMTGDQLLRAAVVLFARRDRLLPDFHSAACGWLDLEVRTKPSSSTIGSMRAMRLSS